MFNKNKMGIIASLSLILILLAGCGKTSPAPTSASTTTSPQPATTSAATKTPEKPTPSGPYGELRVALTSFGDEKFDPTKVANTTIMNFVAPMYDYPINLINLINFQPGIAEKWEMAPDGLSWNFYLRKGVKFHNGEDLKADDLKFSIEAFAAKDAFVQLIRPMVKSVEAVDDYTVKVYTNGPQPYFKYMLDISANSYQGQLLPKDYMQQHDAEYFQKHPVGSGPFKFLKHTPGDSVEFEANTAYWNGVPEYQKLTIILMPEETTRVAVVKTGEVDSAEISLDSAISLEAEGYNTIPIKNMLPQIMLYGTYQPEGAKYPTADVRVRQALSLAINREEIRKTFFYGKAGAVTPSFLSEQASDIDTAYWMDYAAKAYRFSPDEAKKLLSDAGYSNGFTLKLFTYSMSGRPYLPRLAEIVQGYWAKIGVKAELTPIDWGSFSPLRNTIKVPTSIAVGNASTHGNSVTPSTPTVLRQGFHSTGTYGLVGKGLPELDKLIEQAETETNDAKRRELVAAAVKMSTESYTGLMIGSVPAMVVIGHKVDWKFPLPTESILFEARLARHVK